HYLEVQRKLIYARKLYYRSSIQDVIKEGQTLLIQIVKEERGNKGAACTTYLSLAGRYCVLMPNRIKSGGVSRKITSATDRRRLKDIMHELPLNDNMSLIIRTAGEDKKREDIVRDYNYLIRTWNHIRHSALSTAAPALIYEEGDLIKRALRDMYTKDIGEVIIDGDIAYKTAKDFAKILSPNMSRKIKCRKQNEKPLFQQYQVERELDKLHNPVVQLPSGGYLVINPTEALVSIDVNSGRATHEMDIEETALKTNLEAADEIAKQLRMRNLAGLVVIDFIDMDEPANNHAVEKRMKEAMKPDRARVQIAKMSIFGLLEISRQRMHSSFVESNYVTCPFCKGQGVQRTAESSAMLILRAIEEEGIKGNNNHLEVKVPYDTSVYILNHKRRQLAELEEKYDLEIIISADLTIRNINDYKLEKSHVTKNKPVQTAAASAYTLADEADTDSEETEVDDIVEETSSERYSRGNRHGNRFRRGGRNNRRRGRYNREETGDAPASQSEAPATSEPEKKKTWWKKLLG
ncbi:MAG: Rne/Rng family ribonuclease, partial [Alphaproteobacteria bacterium]|nr:Rne/Rng family ribonuclease [Alphaproteobacteria bacterium]